MATYREYFGSDKINALLGAGFDKALVKTMLDSAYHAEQNAKRNELAQSGLSPKLVQSVMHGQLSKDEAHRVNKIDNSLLPSSINRFALGAGEAVLETGLGVLKGAEWVAGKLDPNLARAGKENGGYISSLDETRKKIKGMSEAWSKAHKDEYNVAGVAGELVGGFADPVNLIPIGRALSLGKKALALASTGAASGAVSAYGGDRDVLSGAGFGAVGAVAIGGAIEGLSKLWSKSHPNTNRSATQSDTNIAQGNTNATQSSIKTPNKDDVEFADMASYFNKRLENEPYEIRQKVADELMDGRAKSSVISDEVYKDLLEFKAYSSHLMQLQKLDNEIKSISKTRNLSSVRDFEINKTLQSLIKQGGRLDSQKVRDIINSKHPASEDEKAITRLINDGVDVDDRVAGFGIIHALSNDIQSGHKSPDEMANRLKIAGFNDENVAVFLKSYEEKDINIAKEYIANKIADKTENKIASKVGENLKLKGVSDVYGDGANGAFKGASRSGQSGADNAKYSDDRAGKQIENQDSKTNGAIGSKLQNIQATRSDTLSTGKMGEIPNKHEAVARHGTTRGDEPSTGRARDELLVSKEADENPEILKRELKEYIDESVNKIREYSVEDFKQRAIEKSKKGAQKRIWQSDEKPIKSYERKAQSQKDPIKAMQIRKLGKLDGAKAELNKLRRNIENMAGIKPIAEFGENYAEYYRGGAEAVKKLLKERKGQVAGAFYRDDLGSIDLVWGNEKVGLKKIISKHEADFNEFGGVEKALDEIVKKGIVVTKNNVDTIWLKNGDVYYLVGLTRGFNDAGKNIWIITAYKKTRGELPKELLGAVGDRENLSAVPALTSALTSAKAHNGKIIAQIKKDVKRLKPSIVKQAEKIDRYIKRMQGEFNTDGSMKNPLRMC